MEETVHTTEPWHPGNICEGKKTLPMSSYEKEKAASGRGGGGKLSTAQKIGIIHEALPRTAVNAKHRKHCIVI